MKTKALTLLVEITAMLLIFALALGLCLKGFSAANETVRESLILDQATLMAQSFAAALRSYANGNPKSAYPAVESYIKKGFTVEMGPKEFYGYVIYADITVSYEGKAVYTTVVSWQTGVQYE